MRTIDDMILYHHGSWSKEADVNLLKRRLAGAPRRSYRPKRLRSSSKKGPGDLVMKREEQRAEEIAAIEAYLARRRDGDGTAGGSE